MLLKLFNSLKKFFDKRYPLFLLILVLISFGQILSMTPWQEDNVIFFKVAHIDEQAGFLGKGILGQGPYRHTITPYYFIYKIFGYNIPVFYGLMLLSYFFATVCIYFLVKEILGKKAGMVASFLFGAGYIASEGFFRVYTSTNISSGIGFTALLFLFFWKYYKSREVKWYFLTVLFYFLTIQVSYVRVHYLILPLLAFDFLFLVLPKLKNIGWFIVRSLPLLLIFREFYIVQGDSRREGVVEVAKALLQGKFEYLNSFLGTLGNLVIPDFIQKAPVVCGASLVLVFFFIAFRILSGENRKLFIFLSVLIASNILAYSVYTPLTVYGTNYRYLAHSFFALCITLSLFSLSKRKVVSYFIVLWGLMFLVLNIRTQNIILSDRTTKIKSFYEDLKKELPHIPKDALIYFDIKDSEVAKRTYSVSFSVAEMPETTAIAWRYGIDRYDFKMFTEFESFEKEIRENKVSKDKIFSFWLNDEDLLNTSSEFREVTGPLNKEVSDCNIEESLTLKCTKPVNSILPVEVNFSISGNIKNPDLITFPLKLKEVGNNPFYADSSLVLQAINYQKQKTIDIRNSTYASSSTWQTRETSNINDSDPGTIWQSDRIAWGNEKTFFIIKLPRPTNLSRLVLLPGHRNNIPSKVKIETSLDGKDWVERSAKAENDGDYLVINFENANSSFIRMNIEETSGGDSPQIAEAWVIGPEFDSLSISQAESFLAEPFNFVKDKESYDLLANSLGRIGKVKMSWIGDKSEKWLSEYESEIDLVYDRIIRSYRLTIPPGGTNIDRFMLNQMTIPGEIAIYSFSAISARVETP